MTALSLLSSNGVVDEFLVGVVAGVVIINAFLAVVDAAVIFIAVGVVVCGTL
jgi:hypothetical protein